MITDSQRTIDRVCDLVIPSARRTPISRVRSSTLSASVFAMPSTAMMIAKASSVVIRLRKLSSPAPTKVRYWERLIAMSSGNAWASCCKRSFRLTG